MGDRSGLKSPRDESGFASLASPLRAVGSQMASSSSDARGQLHRRFTTNNIPTLSTPLSPIGQQRRQAAEPTEFTTAVRTALSLSRALGWAMHVPACRSRSVACKRPGEGGRVPDLSLGCCAHAPPPSGPICGEAELVLTTI